jgi:hypothetical protein
MSGMVAIPKTNNPGTMPTARTASNQFTQPPGSFGRVETLGVGGVGFGGRMLSDTSCGMCVGVVVRDSFRRCLGDSGGWGIRCYRPSSIHSWAHTTVDQRRGRTAGKGPGRVLLLPGARVLSGRLGQLGCHSKLL